MDGIIIINKPQNCTSHDIVYKVKKILNKKVGHTGTLDPMATGVLPLLIGKGTLCSKYLIEHDKIYKVTLQLGKKTDTADEEGNIIEERKVEKDILKKENVLKAIKQCEGEQIQTPPIYSAIKVKGKKLYEYARQGKEVEIPKRKINIYKIELLNINEENLQIEFSVHCSKGTYIRSLCEDLAEKLGNIGYMAKLERTRVGQFDIKNSITIEELEKDYKNNSKQENIKRIDNIDNQESLKLELPYIIPVEKIFEKNEKVELSKYKLKLFLNGVKITSNNLDGVYRVYCDKKFIGTGIIKEKLLKRDVII